MLTALISSVALKIWLHVPTGFRVRVYNALIYIGLKIYGPTRSPKCFRLPLNLYVKVGFDVHMTEAHAMQYITKHCNIPMPHVIDVIEVPTGALIVMPRMIGEPLRDELKRMTEPERLQLAADLEKCFDQLRSIPPPAHGPRICGIDGGSFRCYRIGWDNVGPFETERDFHRFLLYERAYLKERDRLVQLSRNVHERPHRICLSHDDLEPLNILIDKNKRLSAIIDWECAAWLPEYWEYTRSCFHRDGYHEWKSLMGQVFGVWPEELEVEQEIWRYSDPY